MGKKKGDEQMEQELEEPEMEDSIESNEDAKEVIDLPGVGAATAEKLRIAGYDDLMSIAVATPGELIEASGVNEAMAKKIIAAARTSLKMGFESGEDFLIRRQKVNKISTGSVAFDKMVGGGFETGAITEIYSAYGGGKTQIAHMLAINVQKAFDDAVVVFIDTESTFRPERIVDIAKANGLEPEKVLKQITV